MRFRCSCSLTMSRCSKAPTSTSRATWPRASRSSEGLSPLLQGDVRLGLAQGLGQGCGVALEALVEEIDHRADPRRVADPLVSQEPEYPRVTRARGKAADQVRLRVGDHAGQRGNSESRADAG